MQIISDTAMRLQCRPYEVFVRAYKHLGIADPEAEARESWRHYRTNDELCAHEQVIDYCLDVLTKGVANV